MFHKNQDTEISQVIWVESTNKSMRVKEFQPLIEQTRNTRNT
jgi:hypothetical protein